MTDRLLRPGERLDDLQRNGLRIIQHPSAFRFGMDAVLLADFTRLKPHERVADMGTGTGILPLLMSQKQPDARFEAFEIQPDMADMARRSVALNGLEERIRVYAADMRTAHELIGRESMHAAVCNPPYGKRGGALANETAALLLARHETDCTIEDITASCAAVLRTHGRLSMVFPTPRLLELLDAMRLSRLEPKRIRMVCAREDRAPYLALVEAMKNAKPGLLWMPPLIVYRPDGSETDELKRIYHQA